MRVKGASYESGEVVAGNDIVSLKVSGGSGKKYNKENLEIAVGLDLYNEDIEDALIGMKVNESKTIAAHGADITFTVLSIRKKVYSEITLEQAKAEDPTITSVDEYKDKIYHGICDNLIRDKAEKLQLKPMIKKLLKTVDVKYDYEEADKDLLENCNGMLQSLSQGLKDESTHDYMAEYMRNILISGDFTELNLKDGMTKEEYIDSLNDDELVKSVNEAMVTNVRNIYINVAFCEKNGIDLSKEAYENMVKKQSEIYNIPDEVYKQQNTFVSYRYFNIHETITRLLIDYLMKHEFIEVIVK